MQTSFAPEQLEDSHVAASEKILRSCVHCGFCTATCPTYLLEGDELDSPRGRIYLIKDMLETNRKASAEVVKHVDRCLSCLSCMTTCPSGVNYMHLVDHARAYIDETYRRPLADRFIRTLLAKLLPYPERFRLALKGAVALRPLTRIFAKLLPAKPTGMPSLIDRLVAMLSMAPAKLPRAEEEIAAGIYPAQGARRGRVALLMGCAQPVLDTAIHAATIRLLTRLGFEVVLAKEAGCCGAIVLHMGRKDEALALARRNIEAWSAEIERQGLDAILINTSGCGTTIKDYGFLFRDDPLAAKAAVVAGLAKDISEFLSGLDWPSAAQKELTVAYHSACSLQHGQKITDAPKRLLQKMGFTVRDVPEGHICCGSAGTYNLLQPFFAKRLKERKVANIERLKPDVVACGNIGCLMQIASGTDLPVVHTVELLDWATGGPRPAGMGGGR